ncbi:MAG: elongation factor 4 [Ignavibacteria bacterium]|nr:elongation factor 4 [Ignavibacteria bacterium]
MNSKIRNFCIIAHIDHGKSTLADRLIEETHTIAKRNMIKQVLDDMDLEQERGITIKLHAIQLKYKAKNNELYTLNLIDTPGHVDFSYEVSRSLAACEGALLVVDASQGIEAQTVSNLYLAIDANLTIIPVINKVDLPSANVENVKSQIIELLGCNDDEIILASAKANIGTEDILESIVHRIPAPKINENAPLRALVFDSTFDAYRGIIVYLRVVDGILKKGDRVKFFATEIPSDAEEVGTLRMNRVESGVLHSGDVGYMVTGIKTASELLVGDTIVNTANPAREPLGGYKKIKPMVFSGIYPSSSDDFEDLRESLIKLKTNDASLIFEPETSSALGFGFRCGFLGLLHMEITQERLDREYNQTIITTVPNVEYQVYRTDGEMVLVDNPSQMPPVGNIDHVKEPYIRAQILTPSDYMGNIMKLANDRRGVFVSTNYLSPTKADLIFEFPLSEIIFDFHDKLKSISKGYASLDYEFIEYRQSDLVKLDILLNNEPVDALSSIVHRTKSYEYGRKLCHKLKELIPRQMFEIVIQGAIGAKIISRETVKALRKNVIAKCYGGDISRKRKLLEKQKEGKKRMKQVGAVQLPQEAFLAVLAIDE